MLRRTFQRNKLKAIGHEARALIARGVPLELVMERYPVSRATFYRALKAAAMDEAATASSTLLSDPEPNPSTHWLLM
jgi:hypothetical protein